MNRFAIAVVATFGAFTISACSDSTDDVVQPSAPGAAPAPVTEQAADTATARAAIAFDMSRYQLEDADLQAADGTDLGDVETLVLDAGGQLTQLVVELEGAGDVKVVVPVSDVRAAPVPTNGSDDRDLMTDLTAAQLAAMPRWTPPAR
ncbi:hypothetical protein [Brevundimonas sp.]|uniref:hypothetical protein n=1 Tax=Brevundimonas sp. TaxID=1871086 RepID=UPI0035AF921E